MSKCYDIFSKPMLCEGMKRTEADEFVKCTCVSNECAHVLMQSATCVMADVVQ